MFIKISDAELTLNKMVKSDDTWNLSEHDKACLERIVSWVDYVRFNTKDAAYMADEYINTQEQ